MDENTAKDQVWFVTGSSSGFGKALVKQLIESGFPVVATARKVDALTDLPDGPRILKLALDVTKADTIAAAVAATYAKFDHIDVLVNNAGYGYFGAIEESDQKAVRAMMDTNFWGANDMTLAVLPKMRQRRSGRILNVTSIGGLRAFPPFAYYHATKFAMEGLFLSLRTQVEPLGIHVTNVEPGGFRTEWAGASHSGATVHIDDYTAVHEGRAGTEANSGSQDGDPALAAKAFIKLAGMDNPPAHYLFGTDAYEGATEAYRAALNEFETYKEDSTHLSFGDDAYWA